MTISESLKRVREQKKITQVQAAKAAGVSEAVYQFYEYGKNEPTAKVIIALSKYYGVSADYLLGLSDNPNLDKEKE